MARQDPQSFQEFDGLNTQCLFPFLSDLLQTSESLKIIEWMFNGQCEISL